MNTIVKTCLVVAIAILTSSVIAQNTVEFPKNVNLIKMTDAGVAIVGTDDALYGVDKEGNQLWKNEKLKKVEAERVEILTGSELIFVSDKGLLARNRVLNVLDGREYANSGVKGDNIFAARVIHGANQLWVSKGGNKSVDVWDIERNTFLYTFEPGAPFGISLDKSVSLTATFSGAQPITYSGNNSAIIHLGLAQLGKYDLDTGAPIWMFDWKPYKVKKPGEKGDSPSKPSSRFSVMKVDQSDGTLYFPFMDQLIAVDSSTGSPKWGPKEGKTGKVFDMYVTDEGVLTLTGKGLNLINKSNGEPVWDKPIKIKGANESLLIRDGVRFFTVSKSSVIEVDVKSRSTKALTEKIKFQGGETFNSMQSFDDILVLKSAQNSVAIDKNSGEIIHSTYFKEPGPSLGNIAQNVALAAVAVAATYSSYQLNSSRAAASGGGSFTYHQYTPQMIKWNGSNTISNDNIAYVSTKFKDADAQGFGVVRLDVKTGEITEKIVIGSREPIYAVDEDQKIIFFKSGKNSVEIKRMS